MDVINESVSFNISLVFDNCGKVLDYQKTFDNSISNSKTLNIFLPLCYNNRYCYKIKLLMAVDNTYPRDIIEVIGFKSETDLNKYTFDLTNLYKQYYVAQKSKPGLCKVCLYLENDELKFQSESFRL